MPPRIFISYRREDAAGDAGRLADHLHRRFGKENVFLDIDTINPGTDFVRALQSSLQETAAVLVVIGPRWTSLVDASGVRRLDSPNDFVRLEVEAALGRNIPVVPVLVQGATMPRTEDLPASLASLVTRQAAGLDHAEFHDDAERLCDRLETVMGGGRSAGLSQLQGWWPAAALVAAIAIGLAAYLALRSGDALPVGSSTSSPKQTDAVEADTVEDSARADALVAEALAQRRRNQFLEALATLARAREAAPSSATIRQTQEDVAMDWIRNVRVENGKSSFGEAIKPALAVIDSALPSATGVRRADLLAHTGWAAFLLRRDGDRRLSPAETYQEALSIDPVNPYANAMLAHWVLLEDDVPRAVKLFETALQSGRAPDAVRGLQWAGYGNARTPEADVERVRLADAMRRANQRLNGAQAQALWPPYYFAMSPSRDKERQLLLDSLPPDDHISTLQWAFEDYAAKDDSRRQTIRYYVALLDARAGRPGQALADLRALNKELADSSGSLRDAVQAALKQLRNLQ